MREYDLYIFDFDNTLFDTRQGIDAILSCALPAIGIEYEPSQFTKYLGMNIDQVFERYSNDPNAYDEFCRRFYSVVNSDAYRGAVPFPEAESTLRGLKARGKHVGIASGKKRYKIETLLSDRGMDDIPETIVGWDETELHKPEPDPIALAFSAFDVPKDRTLYIGDSPNDSLASQAFGVDCAIVNRHNELSVDGIPCTYEIESLSELLDW
ncbi:MAG: HAD hydrolase-like protein [Thermoplasmata archaeon]|nr:HAD hydrolase-like protein [Thermoplasmata archaeon]